MREGALIIWMISCDALPRVLLRKYSGRVAGGVERAAAHVWADGSAGTVIKLLHYQSVASSNCSAVKLQYAAPARALQQARATNSCPQQHAASSMFVAFIDGNSKSLK